ncbi:MAG: RNA methyltransferase, partial [bacterium]
SSADTKLSILLADRIEDPQNLGAIIRTAHCAGVLCLLLDRAGGLGLTAGVARASAGAISHLPVCRTKNIAEKLQELKANKFKIFGLDSGKENKSLYDIDLAPSTVFVLGSEHKGISPHIRRECDEIINIPFAGNFNSLNVSVAAGICLFEALRQRGLSL